MVIDNIKNREKYYALGKNIKSALEYFASVDVEDIEKTDVNIEDTDVIVKVRPMMTKYIKECTFESHKKYIDIHFVAYGTECIGYSNVENLKEISYNEKNDAAFLEGEGDVLTLEKGDFMITFPQDAHMPCICKEKPVKLGKMIAKIKA